VRGSGGIGRGLVIIFGVLLAIAGLASVATGGTMTISGLTLVVVGLGLIVAAVVERFRYRSEVAERSGLPIGPGGGEPQGERLDPRFDRTDEIFVDPTSGRRMRVWLDRVNGERRYRAED
jgi:hypothetical protein